MNSQAEDALYQYNVHAIEFGCVAAVFFFAMSVVAQQRASKRMGHGLSQWWMAGGRQLSSAGVVVSFFFAFILLMLWTEVAYSLKGSKGAGWDFLSFSAPSTSAIVVVFTVARGRRWWLARVFRQAGFGAQIIAISGIPIGYVGYVVSHYFPGLDVWLLRTLAPLFWMPAAARFLMNGKATKADVFFVLGWSSGVLAIIVAVFYLDF